MKRHHEHSVSKMMAAGGPLEEEEDKTPQVGYADVILAAVNASGVKPSEEAIHNINFLCEALEDKSNRQQAEIRKLTKAVEFHAENFIKLHQQDAEILTEAREAITVAKQAIVTATTFSVDIRTMIRDELRAVLKEAGLINTKYSGKDKG